MRRRFQGHCAKREQVLGEGVKVQRIPALTPSPFSSTTFPRSLKSIGQPCLASPIDMRITRRSGDLCNRYGVFARESSDSCALSDLRSTLHCALVLGRGFKQIHAKAIFRSIGITCPPELGKSCCISPFLCCRRAVEFPALRRDQVVQRAEAVGDFLLLMRRWRRDRHLHKVVVK